MGQGGIVSLTEKRIAITDSHESLAILGRHDEHLRMIHEEFDCKVTARGEELIISGDEETAEMVGRLVQELLYLHREGNQLTGHDVRYGIRMVKEKRGDELRRMFSDTVIVTARGRHIKPKTAVSGSISTLSANILLPWGLDQLEPERPTWRWPWLFKP